MSKNPFASRTAFDALQIDDSDEESEEEVVPEVVVEESPTEPPVKMTKTAMKKAAKAARDAKRQQRLGLSRDVSPSPSTTPDVPKSHSPAVQTFSLPKEPIVVEPPPPPEPVAPTTNGLNGVIQPPPAPVADLAEPPKKVDVPEPIPVVPAEPPAPPPVIAAAPAKATVAFSAPPQPPAPDTEQAKKRQNVVTRTVWTLIMIFGFIGLLLLGHGYMVILVMICQTLVYREVTALFSLKKPSPESKVVDHGKKDPWSKTLNWYFFAVTNYFLYGESIIYYFKHVVFADAQLLPFATNHRMISFVLYTIGFMGFVMSLKKGYLKQQFGLFCWVHMTLLLIVVSSHFIVNNILEGLIWFFVPASLVICNDVFAYIWGQLLGHTPLISLSPKKTVEGFVGAFITTVLFSLAWGSFFMGFDYMICPVHDLGVSAWSSVACRPNPAFIWKEWQIWAPVANFLYTCLGVTIKSIPYVPYHFHLIFMSTFASLVAPFGGFFASGFKRAFDIKDFGHSIPGHGGMTDRMDCQFLMGVFVYVYHSTLIREHHVTVGSVLQTIVSGLTVDEQLELIGDLKRYLEGQGIRIPC
ncbi:hypothetical protein BDZ89DRAFT_1101640 [Hymenopellis radicata]|nr:hypothetical protein BDZ89DRAFT_1101640 [Hymenopellis radicata]